MIRGFVSGLFWGGIVAVLGLAVVSMTMPLAGRQPAPGPVAALPAPAVTTPVPVAPVPALPAIPAAPVVPDPAPAVQPVPRVDPVAVAPAPVAPDPAPALPGPVAVSPPAPARPGAESALPGLALPAAPVAPAPDAGGLVLRSPEPPPPGSPAPGGPAAVALGDPAPTRPGAEAPPAGVVPIPPAPVGPAIDPAANGPVILPPAPPAAQPITPAVPVTPPQPAPPVQAEPGPRPQPGFSGGVEGVRTGRLPRIGGDVAAAAPAAPVLDLDKPDALRRNARSFANPDGKPPFAVLLVDTGDTALDLAALAGGDLALTLVVDPAAPGAAERAAIWRAAGQEVALLTAALPKAGTAADMEVALETLTIQFPQALALVDMAQGGMQGDRMAATALIPALRARGFGLVTWDRGLNAADQVARREGLPAATVFRDLDAEGEAAPVIRRYLDRAAFKAQQDGRALVIGQLRPETVKAVTEWALDGRATALAPAPLSALLAAR